MTHRRTLSVAPCEVTVHFYSGRGILQRFGHLAVQINNLYYSYGLNKEHEVYVRPSSLAIQAEEKIYGKRVEFKIPVSYLLPTDDLLKKAEEWRKAWKPSEYFVFTKNCTNAAINLILCVLNPENASSIIASLQGIADNLVLRPQLAGEFLGSLFYADFSLRLRDRAASVSDRKQEVDSASSTVNSSRKALIKNLIGLLIDVLSGDQFLKSISTGKKTIPPQDIQAAIISLLALEDQVDESKLPHLETEINKLLPRLKKLGDYTQQQLTNMLNIIKSTDAIRDEEIYRASYKRQTAEDNQYVKCLIRYEALKKMLNAVEGEDYLSLKLKLDGLLDKIQELNELTVPKNSEEQAIAFKLYDDFRELVLTVVNKIDLAAIAKFSHVLYEHEKSLVDVKQQLLEDYEAICSYPLQTNALSDFAQSIVTLCNTRIAPLLRKNDKIYLPVEYKIDIKPGPTQDQVKWLLVQIEHMRFIEGFRNSKEVNRINQLLIKCKHEIRKLISPEKIFQNIFALIDQEWESARNVMVPDLFKKTKKINKADEKSESEEEDMEESLTTKAIHYLNTQKTMSYLRMLYVLWNKSSILWGLRPQQTSLQQPYFFSRELDYFLSNLQDGRNITMLLSHLLVSLNDLSDHSPWKHHLLGLAEDYQFFIKNQTMAPAEALKEFVAAIVCAKELMPDTNDYFLISSFLESMIGLVLIVPDPTPLIGQELARRMNRVQQAIEDPRYANEWKECSIVRSKIYLDQKETRVVPREIANLYKIIRQPNNSMEAVADYARSVLNKPGCRAQLVELQSTEFKTLNWNTKLKATSLFLLGIIAMQMMGTLPEGDNPLMQIRKAGLAYLPRFLAEKQEAKDVPLRQPDHKR